MTAEIYLNLAGVLHKKIGMQISAGASTIVNVIVLIIHTRPVDMM